MPDFSDVLGRGSLPPGFDPSLPGPGPEWASPPPGMANSVGDLSTGESLNIPVGPPAATTATPHLPAAPPPGSSGPVAGGVDLQQILGMLRPQQPQQPQGVLSPNSQFMAALGAGLSSAGQNWNKPPAAAFASGAGAALQGGQQWNNPQQDAKLKALHAAIAAWKAGDLAAYYQALAIFRATAASAAGPMR
jgi:hypothetical protein